MKRIFKNLLPLVALCISAGNLAAQSVPPTPADALVNKSSTAVSYEVDKGDTKVDLKATTLIPEAKGEAKVEVKQGITYIEAKVERLGQPGKLGTQFLTYVLWAVSPDGRTSNLGEIRIDENGNGELKVTSQLQTFSLIVTSEPYQSVRQPSELVVLENALRKDTKGKSFTVDQYRLMKRTQYEKVGNPLSLTVDTKNVPLEMYQARNAVDIAKSKGADKYAPEIYNKAEGSLKIAEELLAKKADKKEVISAARLTVQVSEDSRALAADRQEQERVNKEREAAAATAAATAKTEAEAKAATEAAAAKLKADAENKRQAELAAANEARLKAEAKAEADALQAQANALQAKEAAARAETERVRKAAEAARAELLSQLNRVLDTKDTPRGLVVNMADVLFDTGKYDLKSEAREKLARLSGILATHPDLQLNVEGHTDNTGGVQINQTLSEQRAQAVAKYLVDQGVSGKNLKSTGLGDSQPVADNTSATGRQKNRRVEIIVSGEAIGSTIGK